MEISVATQPDDTEPLELTEELKPGVDPDALAQPVDPDDPDADEQERVTFDDEEGEEPAEESTTFRAMRLREREKDRRIAELERQIAPAKVEVGPKPTLWDDEIAGDETLFEKRLLEWHERENAADQQETAAAEENRKINEAWQADITGFEQEKSTLSFEDRDEAIETVTASLPRNWQAAAIIKAAAKPALFFYALSKSPTKLAELSKFEDPIKMAAAVARMEGAVKVVKGRKAPDPDRPERGSAQMPGGADKQLEKLEEEAKRNGGDRTKIIAFKVAQKAKGK